AHDEGHDAVDPLAAYLLRRLPGIRGISFQGDVPGHLTQDRDGQNKGPPNAALDKGASNPRMVPANGQWKCLGLRRHHSCAAIWSHSMRASATTFAPSSPATTARPLRYTLTL